MWVQKNLSKRALELDEADRAHVNFLLWSGNSINSRSEIRLLNLLLREILNEGPCLSWRNLIKLKSPHTSQAKGPNSEIW